MQDLIQSQIAHEDNLHAESVEQAETRLKRALESGRLDQVPRARVLMLRLMQSVTDGITAAQEAKAAGPAANLRHILRAVPADVLAAISIRTGLRMCMQGSELNVQSCMRELGRALVRELEVRLAYQLNQSYYDRTVEYLKSCGTVSPRHIDKTMQAIIHNVVPESSRIELDAPDLVKLGKFMADPLLEAGMLTTRRFGSKGGTQIRVVPSPEVKEYLMNSEAVGLWGGVGTSIALAPPVPWTGVFEGGYHTPRAQQGHPFLRRAPYQTKLGRRRQLQACTYENMPKVYDAANYLQSIPYCIDSDTFDVVRQVWEQGGGALGIPKTTYTDRPDFPLGAAWVKAEATEEELEVFNAWKRRVHRWHVGAAKHRAACRDFGALYRVVRQHHGKPCWFPVHVDSRGRLYYWGAPNPQGTDMAKACLRFHEKRPLGPRGLYWIKVHIANCYGFDKLHFDQRAAWVDEHMVDLRVALAEGADSELLRAADSPLCMLAAIRELCRALEHPAGHEHYPCGLPIHMDATCSGLQHFSAILRDPVGGRYVNLLGPGESKADIYSRVLQGIEDRLGRVVHSDDVEAAGYARLWLSYAPNRALTKGPCMTLVYGTTFRGITDHCLDWMDDHGHQAPAGVPAGRLAAFMTRLLLAAIREVVPAAVACMEWLQGLIRHMGKRDSIHWTSPLGMRVFQQYPVSADTTVRIRSLMAEVLVIRMPTDDLDMRRNANGISPNFVHSMDSAHLGRVGLRMQAGGHQMAAIHDSMGTHPSDVDRMHELIREEFVAMYTERDVLADLVESLGLNDKAHHKGFSGILMPERGTLDLEEVRKSWAFFC